MIAQDEIHTRLLEDLVVGDERVAHGCPELVALHEPPQVVIRLVLRIAIEALYHLLALDEERGVERHVGGQERLLILIIDLIIGELLSFSTRCIL